jgi:hypothetical protein
VVLLTNTNTLKYPRPLIYVNAMTRLSIGNLVMVANRFSIFGKIMSNFVIGSHNKDSKGKVILANSPKQGK